MESIKRKQFNGKVYCIPVILKRFRDCLLYTKKETNCETRDLIHPWFITALNHGYRCFIS